jgi:hypothetical protein
MFIQCPTLGDHEGYAIQSDRPILGAILYHPDLMKERKNMPCMFCGSEENLTSEHVFPAFMGGELEVPAGSCNICNGKFAVWEGKIEKATSLLLHILQIGNRYNDVPNAKFDVSVRGMDFEGLTALREPDGTFNLQDKVRETVKSDGKKHREGLFVSEKSAEKFIERARARGEKTSELAVPEELVYDASRQVTLEFSTSLEARKVVAKIALAAIAFKYSVTYARSSQFDRLRRVLTENDPREIPVRIFSNKSLMASQTRAPHQHSVICYLSAGANKGWIVVTLFGGLTYLVQLTEDYEETLSRQFSIFFDAGTRKEFNPILLANEMSLIATALSKDTVFENRAAIDEQWLPIVKFYCASAGIDLESIPPGNHRNS